MHLGYSAVCMQDLGGKSVYERDIVTLRNNLLLSIIF